MNVDLLGVKVFRLLIRLVNLIAPAVVFNNKGELLFRLHKLGKDHFFWLATKCINLKSAVKQKSIKQ